MNLKAKSGVIASLFLLLKTPRVKDDVIVLTNEVFVM